MLPFRLLLRATLCVALFALALAATTTLCLDGKTDDYYLKLTSPRQHSLILGTSRAAQGLLPSELNSHPHDWQGPLFNFAFTMLHSPHGETYLNAVRHKLHPETRRGLFLIEVNPFSLSNGEESERDKRAFLARMHLFHHDPNPEYVFRAGRPGFASIVRRLIGTLKGYATILHDDGWLEVRRTQEQLRDSGIFRHKLEQYEKLARQSEPAPERWLALRQMCQLLSQHGRVVLIRMPLGPPIYQVEQRFSPQFDDDVLQLATDLGVEYLNLAERSGQFATTDGNHLTAEAGRDLSRLVATLLGREH